MRNFSNFGRVVEDDEFIYIAKRQENEEGKITRISKKDFTSKVLFIDAIDFLNLSGEKLYFTDFAQGCIYSVDKDRKNPTCVYEDEKVSQLLLINDYIYFVSRIDFRLKKLNLNTDEVQILTDMPVNTYGIYKNKIYFSQMSNDLNTCNTYVMNTDGTQVALFYESCIQYINFYKDRIYCTDLRENQSLISLNLEGKDKKTLINTYCYNVNILQDMIVVLSRINENNPQLYTLNPDGTDMKLILLKPAYGVCKLIIKYIIN